MKIALVIQSIICASWKVFVFDLNSILNMEMKEKFYEKLNKFVEESVDHCNLAREVIFMYLDLCEQCQLKKKYWNRKWSFV